MTEYSVTSIFQLLLMVKPSGTISKQFHVHFEKIYWDRDNFTTKLLNSKAKVRDSQRENLAFDQFWPNHLRFSRLFQIFSSGTALNGVNAFQKPAQAFWKAAKASSKSLSNFANLLLPRPEGPFKNERKLWSLSNCTWKLAILKWDPP